MALKEKILSAIEKYNLIEGRKKIIVGLSGGADSMALTDALLDLSGDFGITIEAAHVNHNIRGEEAKRDECFVRDYCEKKGIEFNLLSVDVVKLASEAGMGVEEYARRVRYEFFEKLAGDSGLVATAHTLSDSIETVLFNMARGSGVAGLRGIPAKRGIIIRPLIGCTREDVELYCKDRKLDYVTDSTNLTNDYTRNFIRHNIVPLFYQLNPSFDRCMDRMMENVRQACESIEDGKKKLGDKYSIEELRACSDAVRYAVLSELIEKHSGVMAESKHIKLAEGVVFGLDRAQICGGVFVEKSNGRLVFTNELERDHTENFCVELRLGENSVNGRKISAELSDVPACSKIHKNLSNRVLDYDRIQGIILLRNRLPGDSYRPAGRNCTKSLKKLFNERKIPPDMREKLFILCDDKGIIWVEGFGADERVSPRNDTSKYLYIESESPF